MKQLCCCLTVVVFLFSCKTKKTLFSNLSYTTTGITFANTIKEDDYINVLNYEYMYNGGGVGVADFNNDSLPDIYFTGNFVPNKLYLNKGNFKFTDITDTANVAGEGKWNKGVSIVDINNDGWQDIYICAGVLGDSNLRKNILYINEGVDKKTGIPHFENKAEEYGLADAASSHMAAFFDYDNDGDLDVYVVENAFDGTYANEYRPIIKDGSKSNTDKLFKNNWNATLNHPVFEDVSKQAGIQIEGYGLGVAITDINKDGWLDIYVSNDYLSNNLLYINNKNGTFTDKCAAYFKHTSKNAMGNDIADINNDGLQDIIEVDMAPGDNYRQKMMMNDIGYSTYQNNAMYGYITQYARNMLQLNVGNNNNLNDSTTQPVFSEIAYSSGVANTDWSWAPLLVDADNDGFKDLLISNGLPKDMSDLDFISYRNNTAPNTPKSQMLAQLPSIKIANTIFKNNGNTTFSNKTIDWGWNTPTFSAGMAYADFDNDGDMDVVVNNSNMEASILQNNLAENNFVQLQLQGDSLNKNAIGSIVTLFANQQQQTIELSPYRGYLSSVSNIIAFGIGNATVVDSIIIEWPNKKVQKITNVAINKKYSYSIKDAVAKNSQTNIPMPSLFTDITTSILVNYKALEEDFIDFDVQRLLPHKLSQYGPSIAVGDINGDKLDDFIIGGGSPLYAKTFVQNANGTFSNKRAVDSTSSKLNDDAGICLLDADNDGDLDLYIASGGAEAPANFKSYADHFYSNDGKGNFTEVQNAIPINTTAKSCVKAADYDLDGDIDLFIGGRALPGKYPMPVSSVLLRNDSKNGVIKFTDVTKEVAPQLENIGMVTDAVFSDVNNDNNVDLVVVGEFMPITILVKQQNKFIIQKTSLQNEVGWWNSISSADVDNDGDMDYVCGNFGNNSFLQASAKYPVSTLAGDFDKNGSYNVVLGNYFLDKPNGEVKQFPVASRDEFIKELPPFKEKFPNYSSFAKTTFAALFDKYNYADALKLNATNFTTCWIENKGNLNFELHILPQQMQWAPVFATSIYDYNNDGYLDIAAVGNEYNMNPYLGRIDAFNGLVCFGADKKEFTPQSISSTNFYVPGNAKSLVRLITNNNEVLIAGQNFGKTKLFAKPVVAKNIIYLNHDDNYALIKYKNGKTRKEEFYYGNSFQSQNSRTVVTQPNMASITIYNTKKQQRVVQIN
jgi:hypothetical protein